MDLFFSFYFFLSGNEVTLEIILKIQSYETSAARQTLECSRSSPGKTADPVHQPFPTTATRDRPIWVGP